MKRFLLLVTLLLTALPSFAHEAHTKHPAPGLSAIDLGFDAKGQLWRVSVKDDFLLVDKSSDIGKTFSQAVKVNATPQNIAASNEARPQIAIDKQGYIYTTWTQNLGTRFAGYIWFARSIDGGKSFEKPFIVHQDRAEITHAFNTLDVGPDGKILVSWIDKRDAMAAKNSGQPYAGAAIYYAVSTDHGQTFQPERKLADATCECCRIATTLKSDGTGSNTIVALWRHVFDGGERDHMIAELPWDKAPAKLQRATFGHWQIDGCPHHGGALATGGEGKDWWGYHLAYFDGNDKKPGLYYSRMDGVAWASSVPKKFGNHAHQAGHPALYSLGEKVWLVWREIDGKHHTIHGMQSDDGGRNWNTSKSLASTEGKTDYPQLLGYGGQTYLLWNTAAQGLVNIKLD
jgi:Neuraminidase (sialidase)